VGQFNQRISFRVGTSNPAADRPDWKFEEMIFRILANVAAKKNQNKKQRSAYSKQLELRDLRGLRRADYHDEAPMWAR
jgi:hypothetical protein